MNDLYIGLLRMQESMARDDAVRCNREVKLARWNTRTNFIQCILFIVIGTCYLFIYDESIWRIVLFFVWFIIGALFFWLGMRSRALIERWTALRDEAFLAEQNIRREIESMENE